MTGSTTEPPAQPTVDVGVTKLTPGSGGYPTELHLDDGRTMHRQPDGTYAFEPEPPPPPPPAPPPSWPAVPPPGPPPGWSSVSTPPPGPVGPTPAAVAVSAPFRGLIPTLASIATVAILAVGIGVVATSDGDGGDQGSRTPFTRSDDSSAASPTTESPDAPGDADGDGDGAEQAIAIIQGIVERCYGLAGSLASDAAPDNLAYEADPVEDVLDAGPGEFFPVRISRISPPGDFSDWLVNLDTGHSRMERPITEHQVGQLLHDLSYAGGQLCPSPHLSQLVDGDDPFP